MGEEGKGYSDSGFQTFLTGWRQVPFSITIKICKNIPLREAQESFGVSLLSFNSILIL